MEVTAVVALAEALPVRVRRTDEGWRFDEDPTALFDNTTPRGALRAFVWATRTGRWDVVVSLAPRRYRIGLSEDRVAAAWTKGPLAEDFARRRDRLSRHLTDPIVHDDHEALLDMGEEGAVHLEREGVGWVIVDF